MGINTIKNLRFTNDNNLDETGTSTEQQIARARELREQLMLAGEELDETSAYAEYLSLDEQAGIQSMRARINAEIQLLDTFIETGEWPGAGMYGDVGFWQDLPALPAGWHGDGINYMDEESDEYWDYEDKVAAADDLGFLEDVIMMPNSNSNTSIDSLQGPALGFVIPYEEGDPRILKVVGRTVANDIWVTATYEDGETKTWVLKNFAVNNCMLYISAQECDYDVQMDFSRVIRAQGETSSNFGSRSNGLVLIGGKGNDIISGSNSDDLIVGWGGDDTIYGLGGIDTIFGDGAWKASPEDVLHSVNDETGGNDYMDGGDSFDTVYGGGGSDDTGVGDVNQPNGEDLIFETENPDEDFTDHVIRADLSRLEDGISVSGIWGTPRVDESTGEVVIRVRGTPAGSENNIVIDIPDGYTMVYGADEADGTDWIITLAKIDEDDFGNPAPVYMRVRIEGVLAEGRQTTLTVNACRANGIDGSILDLSNLHSGGNNVILNGEEGTDTLIGPITALDEWHIKAEDIADGAQASRQTLEDFVALINAEEDSDDIWTEDAAIVSNEILLKPRADAEEIYIPEPEGFGGVSAAFYQIDGDDIVVYVIHVTNREEGEFDLIRLRLDGAASDDSLPAIYIGTQFAEPIGTTQFNAGDGSDLVVGSIGSTTDWGDNDPDSDSVQQGWYGEVTDDSGYDPLTTDSDDDGVMDYWEIPGGTEDDPTAQPEFWDDGDDGDPPTA